MAAKAVNGSKHVDRNDRFRGRGPLLQVTPVPDRDRSGGVVRAAHGRESGVCKEVRRPERSLSRSWPLRKVTTRCT
jgi:hypothetical protein